jgi:hypothetical protein
MDISCISPENARHYLRPVEPKWRAFWFHMHFMVDNLEDLVAGMSQVSDEVFDYHHRAHENDFARWIQEVIGDAILAEAIREADTREEVVAVAQRRIKEIKSAAEAASDN